MAIKDQAAEAAGIIAVAPDLRSGGGSWPIPDDWIRSEKPESGDFRPTSPVRHPQNMLGPFAADTLHRPDMTRSMGERKAQQDSHVPCKNFFYQ
ncbi:hypothetical protein CDD83_9270 [Cordyceps sp. RAO-2017]|nr:hypothetical protein CDD83_9270 [Cordyceps sp. RAO-2017]